MEPAGLRLQGRRTVSDTDKKISLVLGSGGARGLAHIGIIRYLEESGYRIESISGCSMGALIGGIHAAGKLDEYEKWVLDIDKLDIFGLLDFSFGRTGLVKGDKLMKKLKEMIGETEIEDLPISFTAVAADIVREREVWFSKGPLYSAIRASISLPLFFTPYKHKGVNLIDGGLFNPVPIAPTYSDMTDMTIAVNLTGFHDHEIEQNGPVPSSEENGMASFSEKIKSFMTRFVPNEPEEGDDWDYFYVASQSFDAVQGVIARQKLAAHPPDVLIEIPRNACGILEFDRAQEMIDLGYRKAKDTLGSL